MPRSANDPQNPWLYDPSLAAAIIIAHVYFMTTIIHIFQAAHYQTRFCIPLIIGGVWETVGYAIRAASTRNEESIALYATQLTLVVLAPACKSTTIPWVDSLLIVFLKLLRLLTTCSSAEYSAPTPQTQSQKPWEFQTHGSRESSSTAMWFLSSRRVQVLRY